MGLYLRKKLRLFARSFVTNVSGGIDPAEAIIVSISFFLGAIILPMGIEAVYTANVTSWDPAVKTIFQMLFPILAVVGLAMYYIPKRGKRK